MIVLDASAVLEWLLQTPKAQRVQHRFMADTVCAPHLIDVEVAHIIRRIVLSNDLKSDRGAEAIADLSDMRIVRFPHTPFLPRIWELRNNLSAYDAAYVALAESLGAPLVTCDRRMADAPGHRADIEVI